MKLTIFAGILAASLMLTGCISTVNNRTTAGVPFIKDKVEGRYERPMAQVYDAAKTVIVRNGTLINETTLYQTNTATTVKTIQGKVEQANVWIRVQPIEQNITGVLVQTRGKSGNANLDLGHEIEKQIALELVK